MTALITFVEILGIVAGSFAAAVALACVFCNGALEAMKTAGAPKQEVLEN